MEHEDVYVEQRGQIAIIHMNRPPANAFTLEFAEQFALTLDRAMATDSQALVITGRGNFFSGGLDLSVVPSYSSQQQRAFLKTLNGVIGALYGCPRPVVAAVNGHAIAGAFVLALTADYRVGPSDAYSFGLTEARVGIPFPAVPAVVVRSELAPADVRYTTLYAKNFGPDEGVARGLFDELQPSGKVLERAIEIATDLASMPADGYARIKHQFRASAIAEIEELNQNQSDPMLESWVAEGAAEASDSVLKASSSDPAG